jgi:hypothetical protein
MQWTGDSGLLVLKSRRDYRAGGEAENIKCFRARQDKYGTGASLQWPGENPLTAFRRGKGWAF